MRQFKYNKKVESGIITRHVKWFVAGNSVIFQFSQEGWLQPTKRASAAKIN